jgi:DNA-binding response OmpR family regulator
MNGPPEDGNESIVDIFVLSTRITESPVNTAPLEQAGYRVTVFTDCTDLIESLRNGKPNLLICDAVASGDEAYDLCRDLKADYECGVIPVLVVTSASDLSDLLHVLDCNADNFIAYPYDDAYLLSLVEGMVSAPSERLNPDRVKTQFKIQHDDHEFVIAADRRKLLEFLLSTFEITVTRTQDLSRSNGENDTLAASLKKTEAYCETQAGTIERLNVTLRQKELALDTMAADARDRDRQISEKSGEAERLARELESVKSLLASSEEQLRGKCAETEESARTYAAETDGLREQVATLEKNLAAAESALVSAKESLERETAFRTNLEKNLADTTLAREHAEKSARALSLDCEQQRVSLTTEKNRAQSAEYEVKAVLQAKADSEQDLTRIISELKETAKQQAAELARRDEELDAGKLRITNLEIQCANLTAEKEVAAATLLEKTGAYQKELSEREEHAKGQAAELARRNEELDAGNARIAGLEERLSMLAREKDTAEATLIDRTDAYQKELNALEERLKEQAAELAGRNEELDAGKTRITNLETYISALAAEREASDTTLRNRTTAFQKELSELQATCDRHVATLEERQREADALQSDLEAIRAARETVEHDLATLTGEVSTLRQALDNEREEHRATEENLQGIIRERETGLELLRGEHHTVKATLDEHRNVLSMAKSELESAFSTRMDLERSLEVAAARVRDLEAQLQQASATGAETEQRVRALSGEIEEIGNQRLNTESLLAAVQQEKEQKERDLSRVSEDARALQLALEQEQQARKAMESEREQLIRTASAAENEARSREEILARTVRDLTAELESLRAVHQEQENRVTALSSEIDQARTALADEWEDHMNAQERLDAAVQKQLEQSLHRAGDLDPERAKKRSIVVKGPDLPTEFARGPQALQVSRVTAGTPDPLAPRITSVEDLFEDHEEETGTVPSVSIIQEPAGEDAGMPAEQAEDEQETDDEEEEEDDDAIEWDDGLAKEGQDEVPGDADSGLSRDISFNRAQWYDLMKWAHHSGTLSPEQRMQIVRMGRLIQKGRKLTHKQDEQVREMIALVQAQGYRFI